MTAEIKFSGKQVLSGEYLHFLVVNSSSNIGYLWKTWFTCNYILLNILKHMSQLSQEKTFFLQLIKKFIILVSNNILTEKKNSSRLTSNN